MGKAFDQSGPKAKSMVQDEENTKIEKHNMETEERLLYFVYCFPLSQIHMGKLNS